MREFLPQLFAFLEQFGLEQVVAEEGYGERMQVPRAQYAEATSKLKWGSRQDAFSQDLVITLRCPLDADLDRLPKGSALLAMLHFPTRPRRVEYFAQRGLIGVAMDQVVDDLGRRLVENLESVGANGVKVGMEALSKQWSGFASPTRGPLRVTILGAGAVGAHAMRYAVRYGDDTVRGRLRALSVPGVVVTVLDVEAANDRQVLETTLAQTDLLFDATARRDTSQIVVKNEQLALMPKHAVVVDLAVDPYLLDRTPNLVKAIEGIPQGDLDRYVFTPEDPAWDAVDTRIPHASRRTVASCYSWPGIQPLSCMHVYGKQLEPVVRALIEHDAQPPVTGSTWAARATGRALHTRFLKESA